MPQRQKLPELFHKFRKLNLSAKLGLMPRGELAVLYEVQVLTQAEPPACSTSDLAKRLGITTPCVSRTCRNLSSKGYLESVPNPKDRRNICLRLTQAGRDAMRENIEKTNAFMQRVRGRMRPEELEQMYRLADLLYDAVCSELDREKNIEEPMQEKALRRKGNRA